MCEEALRERLGNDLAVIQQPSRKRALLEVACQSRKQARDLAKEFGGGIDRFPRDWLKRFSREQKAKPLRIGKRLVISNMGGTSVSRGWRSPSSSSGKRAIQLIIPAGSAFGTGEHATTAMSLRLLEQVTRGWKPGWSLADLGTGSGILALVAKRFGAKRAVAIDAAAIAISTARANARLNKINNIDFKVGDALRWEDRHEKFEIITANLFSELLIKALPKLRRQLKRNGRLILSGVLRNQEREFIRALRRHGFLLGTIRRWGKWIAILCSGGCASPGESCNHPDCCATFPLRPRPYSKKRVDSREGRQLFCLAP